MSEGKQIGLVIIGVLLFVGISIFTVEMTMPYIVNDAKVPVVREGMCIAYSLNEFPRCKEVYRIKKVGNKNVLLQTKDGKDDLNELSIRSILRWYGEVDCNCENGIVWK